MPITSRSSAQAGAADDGEAAARRDAARIAAELRSEIGDVSRDEVADLVDELTAAGLLDASLASRARQFDQKGSPDSDAPLLRLFALINEIRDDLAEKAIVELERVHGLEEVVEIVALGHHKRPHGQAAGRLGDNDKRAEIRAFIRSRLGRANLYVGTQPRLPTFSGIRRSTDSDIPEHRRVLVDVDRKKAGEDDAAWATRRTELLDKLSSLGPVDLVDTGGGVQAVFDVEPTSDSAEMRRRAALVNKIAKAVGGDRMGDLVRIRRLPWSINVLSPDKRERGRRIALAVPVERVRPPQTWAVDDLAATLQGSRVDADGPSTAPRDAAPRATASPSRGKRGRPAPTADVLRRLMEALPNDGPFDDRSDFVRVLHAIRGAAGDDLSLAVEVAEEWAGRWHRGGDAGEARRVIETMTDEPATGWDELVAIAPAAIRHELAASIFSSEPLDDAEIAAAAAAACAEAAARAPAWITAMNARFALVAGIAGVVDLDEGGDQLFRVRSVQEFKTYNDGVKVEVPGRKAPLGRGSAWLDSAFARRAERIGLWLPGQAPAESINLFRGLPVAPKAGGWDQTRAFLHDVIAAGDLKTFEFVLNWLAAGLQQPLERGETALALVGDRGTGKGTLLGMLGELYGPAHTFTASSPEHLLHRFNAHLEGRLLLVAEEALFGRDRERLGVFKALVTEPTLTIEPKHQQVRTVPNRLKVIIATNDLAGVPVEVGDRRVSVLQVSPARRQDSAYFAGLRAAWAGGEREAFLHAMLTRDLSAFDRRQPLRTSARRAVAEATAKPLTSWWIDVLDSGVLPGAAELAVDRGLAPLAADAWSTGPVMTRFNDLLEDARTWARRERARHTPSRAELSEALESMCPGRTRRQPRVAGRQIEALEFPSLLECQGALNTALGGEG
ncbi:DUF5906 domain-containing protein [Alsobacter sp. R-9]